MRIIILLFSMILLGPGEKSAPVSPAVDIPIDDIKLPPGFKIEVYASGVRNARSMALSPSGTLYVGTRSRGSVYALRDTDGDFKVDEQYTLAKGLKMPNGVAFRDGDLYVAEVSRISKFEDIENKLDEPGDPQVIYDKYPTETHHGWKYINFGPDGKLYVPVGAPCNICDKEDPVYASITRINPDGTGFEVVQHGVRNTVGFTWHPETNDLWFTDNGRDWLGDEIPHCELNHAPKDGMHFGFPYCHQGDLSDPKFGDKSPCSEYTPPAQKMGPHVAPLGLEFYTGDMFPEEYRNQLFVAQHGSWNRAKKIGYRLMLVKLDGDKVVSYEPFAEGWLPAGSEEEWGRPVDVEMMPDGSLLLSDDSADAIYRITYEGS